MARHIKGPLHWERLGQEGRPMVFVHPNPADMSCWVYQMARFSYWFRTIAIDLPGYGKSPATERGVTIEDLADACWEAVDQTTDEPAILAGVSIGSSVVRSMANQRPERTLALIMSGTGRLGGHPVADERRRAYEQHGIAFRRQHFGEILSAGFRDTDLGRYFTEMITERNDRTDANTIIDLFTALSEPEPDWIFANIAAPALIITGSEDSAYPAAFGMQERIPGCELATIHGAGHACNMEKPWEWDRYALDFLARHGLFDGRP